MSRIKIFIAFCLITATLSKPLKSDKLFLGNPRLLDQFNSYFTEALFLGPTNPDDKLNDEYGCFFCLMTVNAIEQYSVQNSISVDNFVLNDYCNLFDASIRVVCQQSIANNGVNFLNALSASTNPDSVCKAINLCPQSQCTLFPTSQAPVLIRTAQSPVPANNEAANTILNGQISIHDSDGDGFSTDVMNAGGYNWMGKDCDNTEDDIYPGREVNPYKGQSVDYNCNGLYAFVPNTNTLYDDLFCRGSTQIGVGVAGDSLTTNFHIPSRWFNSSDWNNPTTQNVVSLFLDHLDQPQSGAFTGRCMDSSVEQPCRSIYNYNFNNNYCNFNDYQNVGLDGAKLQDLLTSLNSLRRNQLLDFPMLLTLQIYSGDICSGAMTSPDDFAQTLNQILTYLDTKLPAGSHVVILGIPEIDIYEQLSNQTHISGASFADFYNYEICAGTKSNIYCPNLLNPDLNVRNTTIQRAIDLNQVYKNALSSLNTKNFDAIYYDFPTLDDINAANLNSTEFYNQIDGLYPSQAGQAFIADYLWNNIERDRPQWVGSPNPYNNNITQVFQSQEAVIVRQSSAVLFKTLSSFAMICLFSIYLLW